MRWTEKTEAEILAAINRDRDRRRDPWPAFWLALFILLPLIISLTLLLARLQGVDTP